MLSFIISYFLRSPFYRLSAQRMRDRRSTDVDHRIDQAGSPFRWVRRTRTLSPPPSTASVDARRRARHERGSTFSPSPVAFDAQPSTPLTTQLSVFSFFSLCSCLFPFASLRLQTGYFSNFGNAEFSSSHGCASDIHVSISGLNQLGSSRLAVLIPTSCGAARGTPRIGE